MNNETPSPRDDQNRPQSQPAGAALPAAASNSIPPPSKVSAADLFATHAALLETLAENQRVKAQVKHYAKRLVEAWHQDREAIKRLLDEMKGEINTGAKRCSARADELEEMMRSQADEFTGQLSAMRGCYHITTAVLVIAIIGLGIFSYCRTRPDVATPAVITSFSGNNPSN